MSAFDALRHLIGSPSRIRQAQNRVLGSSFVEQSHETTGDDARFATTWLRQYETWPRTVFDGDPLIVIQALEPLPVHVPKVSRPSAAERAQTRLDYVLG
jgi:hypothetical protein